MTKKKAGGLPTGKAKQAPPRGMKRSVSSRKLNVAGDGNPSKRPGKGPGESRGKQ